ncbi:protein kinase domain-containing protein [Streptomyces botrytidirepellens]|uniref:Serine/threonine protein kinase n=1 Tax=Streptomyces botrytidirepellens TaxID=2486417 RepID=A0A3M8WYT8_9ACTN|nr:serine/threonine-protein kinase [Streptomyces botrytidirepellens]RNG34220.1 serine/threonine protein kinase [Streptomyces botrytidirepellens]
MPLSTDDPASIGGYALLDRLGSGGMGVVYLGRSASGRQVAVKLVHAQYAQDEEFRTRFRQEITAARKVSGAFTAPVVDADPEAERPWMATQYVPGRTLADVVRDGGPLGGREVRTLGLGLVEALRDIHRAGVVHRDLKPANILMAEDGPRVIDFGISRAADNQTLTLTAGRVLGTPRFMSPEQLRNPREVTAASDVFSLGALVVYAATGIGPFDAESPYLSGYQVMYEPPTLDGVPDPLRKLAKRCLDKDAAARPGLDEVHRMLDALPDFAAAAPPEDAPTRAEFPPARTEGAGRRRRKRLLLVGVGALAVGGLVAGVTYGLGDEPPPYRPAASATADGQAPVSLPDGWRPWRTTLRYEGPLPPLVYQDAACVPDRGTDLYCGGQGFTVAKVDAATGKVRWRSGTRPQDARPIGVRDETVYTYSEPENEERRVVALDTGTRKQRWSHTISGSASARLFRGGLLTLSADGRRLVAYGASGRQLWQSPAKEGQFCEPVTPVPSGVPYVLCSPLTSSGLSAEGPYSLLRLDPSDGAQRTLATLPRKALHLGSVDGAPLFLAPQTAKEVYDAGYERPYDALVRVDPRTGDTRRIPLRHPLRGSATLLNGVVYAVRTNGTVTAVSARSGKQLWQRETETESLSAPVESKRHGRLYFANRFGRLLALDSRTGTEAWRTSALSDPGDTAQDRPPSVLLVKDAIVAMAGDTVFSVRPDRPKVPDEGSAQREP